MNPFKQRQIRKTNEAQQQELFREYYPLLLSILEEIQPLLEKRVDQREVLAMSSMMLGRLLRSSRHLGRRELRKAIEQQVFESFAIDRAEEAEAAQTVSAETHNAMRGSRILVVDDSAMARRQISFFLKKDGFEVYEAKSGEEALWLIQEVDPELILMDVSMDGMDGIEACRRLREDPANQHLPVIFLSAKGERDEIVAGFKAGAIDYIVKPFHPAESLTRIRTHLSVKKLAELREKHILELKQINKTKDRILRIASHDLRNPVAAIAGLAGFLKDDCRNMTEAQAEIVDCIEQAGKGVVQLLNELLDISAMDNGHVDLKREPVQICELVRNVVPLFRGEAVRKRIDLNFTCDPDLPEVSADRQQLRRVADNLISNAIKFTPPEGSVDVRVRKYAHGLGFEVRDTGPGIPEEESSKLFKEFGKTSNQPTGGEPSTGLGLSICHRIVEAHGGSITFKNLPEGGVCFSVILPAIQH